MRRLRAALALALAVAVVPGVAQAQSFDVDFAAQLSGAQEVPPVPTDASGTAVFDVFEADGRGAVRYAIRVEDIDNVVAAHIHLGCPGENGPVVVTLFSGGPTGEVNGPLVRGVFTAEDLEGPLEGRGLGSLIRAMQSGCTYVNVHTTEFPGGEIRGQIHQVDQQLP